ncbi:MAG TPA: LPS export ABC transporter periplasmic protein LptC [Bacteroidia bacterium]|nr:LPS export ABC transporter periplasmic protein LptC [Bacteroidia bacterium]
MNHTRIAILVLMLSVLCMASCENNLKTVDLITAEDKTPLLVENNATIYYTDSARAKLKLTAPVIESYGGKDPYDLFRKGMKTDFYDDSMHVSSHVTADSAIMHNNKNNKLMEADRNVVVVNKKGEQLNTEQLFWDETKHVIYTNKAVTIKTATEILFGDGLKSNEDFTDYQITSLHGTVMLNDTKK